MSTDAAWERLVGVDSGKIAFSRVYQPYQVPWAGAEDLWLYDVASASIAKVPGLNAPQSVSSLNWDFGDGVLTWVQAEYLGSNNFRSPKIMAYVATQGLSELERGSWPYVGPITNGGTIAWSRDDSNGRGQVFVWPSRGQITSGNKYHGGGNLGVGLGLVTYNEGGTPGLFAYDTSGGGVTMFTDQSASGYSLRMDQQLAVWASSGESSGLYYAYLKEPDLSVVPEDIVFSNDSPNDDDFGGTTINVAVEIRNLSTTGTTQDITARLYYDGVEKDARVISGGLGARSHAGVLFPSVFVGSEGTHEVSVRIDRVGGENPANNRAARTLVVRDSDTQGPDIYEVEVSEYDGDGDGIIESHEQVKISWRLSDASGLPSAAIQVNGGDIGPVEGLGAGNPITASCSVVFGPLAEGEHDFTIAASDADESEALSQYKAKFDVFAGPPPAILGLTWNDLDGDGIVDDGEPGLANWRVYLDENSDGQWNAGEPLRLTDRRGKYAFADLAPGTYVVTELVPSDWRSAHPSTGMQDVTVGPGEVASDVNFGNRELARIHGNVWTDGDGDGLRDSGEAPRENRKVFLDLNRNGQWDPEEPFRLTDESGNYTISGLFPGTYSLVRMALPLWEQTFPIDGPYTLTVGYAQIVQGIDFGERQVAEIRGRKWYDLDRDQVRDSDEPGLASWKIYVDENRNEQWDDGERYALTDTNGDYVLTTPLSGAVAVAEVMQPGWRQTYRRRVDVPALTISEPPGSSGFGKSVAALANEVVVGSYWSATAYSFDSTTGEPRATFRKPPQGEGATCNSVAAMGSRVLLGTPGGGGGSGAAYVFDAESGGLLKTIANPSPDPADEFGESAAAFGSTGWIIGAYRDGTPAPDAGIAYLFDLEGNRVATFNSPSADSGDRFGYSVAATESFVVVGAYQDGASVGAVYVFDRDGNPVRTIPDPDLANGDGFGFSLAAFGNNILVGASQTGTPFGAKGPGVVYLFDLSTGERLLTFENPTPANGESFGFSVAATRDYVIIGAPYAIDDRSQEAYSGAVYVFDGSTAELVATLPNPKVTPRSNSYFGASVAAYGGNIFVGAPGSGAAYVFWTPDRIGADTVTVTPGQVVDRMDFGNYRSNEAPTDIALSADSVPENRPVGTVVGALTTTDPDSGETFKYSLAAGEGDQDNALFSVVGDQLRTAAVFDFESKSSYSIRVRSTDQGLLGIEEAVIVTVSDVNEAPSFTKGSDQTVLEDAGPQTVASWATNILSEPANESSQTVQFLVTNDNDALFSVQPAIAANGTLTYTPALNANGFATVSVRLKDDGGTANGGQDTSEQQTFTITVTAVNDAPAGANNAVTTLEDTAKVFAPADFGFSDPNDVPANALLAVTITTLPAAGSLTNNGVAVTAGQSIPVADILGGKLSFLPALNANGAAYAGFTFQVQDDGGVLNGGVDLDPTPNTMTINVTPVNDSPILDPIRNKSVNQRGILTFTATATDPEFPPETLTYTLDPVAIAEDMRIDPATGVFTWTPTTVGEYQATITVTDNGANPANLTDFETITITVGGVATPLSSQRNLLLRRKGRYVELVNKDNVWRRIWRAPVEDIFRLEVRSKSQGDTLTVDFSNGPFVIRDGVFFDAKGGKDALVIKDVPQRRSPVDQVGISAEGIQFNGVSWQGRVEFNGTPFFWRGLEAVTIDVGKGADTVAVSGLGVNVTLIDGGGVDLLNFTDAARALNLNLGASSAQRIFAGNARTLTLKGTIENVVGTDLDDVIRGNKAANRIEGRSGNDMIYGNEGNDRLFAGTGNNVLLGGDGNDVLDVLRDVPESSVGRNLLIGGNDRDTLQGGPGEETLIGGTTTYDNKAKALKAVLQKWSSSDSFAARCDALRAGFRDPKAGVIRLLRKTASAPNDTVLEDNIRDRLFGDTGSDWFLALASKDDIVDPNPDDRLG